MTLTAAGITVDFGGGPVLCQLSLAIQPASITVVKGKNGAGKTTLLEVLSGFVPVSDGEVWLNDQAITNLQPAAVARAGMTCVRQRPRLIQSAAVIENVVFGADSPGEHPLAYLLRPRLCHRAEREARAEAYAVLEQLGLARRSSVPAFTLSLGEVKLVALARAVLRRAKIFLFDEILSGLGGRERGFAMNLIYSVAERGAAVLCVEHEGAGWEATEARILFLERGQLCETQHA